jgi:hypothetical protein
MAILAAIQTPSLPHWPVHRSVVRPVLWMSGKGGQPQMKPTRKMQRLHELQVTRSIMTETGQLTLGANKARRSDEEIKNVIGDQNRAKQD